MKIQLSDHFTYGKLLRFTIPTISMMIFTSIYSVVDGYFVSNFAGKTPFAAVNLIMPFLMILGTVGFIFGTGGTALVAMTYGQGDQEKANEYFSLFVYLAFALGIVFAVLGMIFIRPAAKLLGADGELLDNCVRYGRIILAALPFFITSVMFQSFFVAAERPKMGMLVTVFSGIINMILDAVLVLSLPQDLKLIGAAIATAIAQTFSGVVPLVYFLRNNSSILKLGKTKYDGKAVRKACTNGLSEFMTNISMSIVGMLYNLQLIKYAGENGIVAYGVMMYVSMIFGMAFGGYSMGTAPVISFHFGAQNKAELSGLLKKSLVILGISGIGMFAVAELLAVPLASIFVGYYQELMQLTVSGFRIFSLVFLFMGFSIFSSGFFTALNDGVTSAIISFLRTMVFECAAVMLLPRIFGTTGIWASVLVAEGMSLILGTYFLITKKPRFGY